MKASFTIMTAGLLLGTLLQSSPAGAAVLDFDFATVGGGNPLASQITVGGVTANGFVVSGGVYTPAPLWKNTIAGENGIGVCSENAGNPNACAGFEEVNELSNQANPEVLRLT